MSREITNLRFDGDETVIKFVSKFQQYLRDLESGGLEMNDEITDSLLLSTLSGPYERITDDLINSNNGKDYSDILNRMLDIEESIKDKDTVVIGKVNKQHNTNSNRGRNN